jgi:hypothetical protein
MDPLTRSPFCCRLLPRSLKKGRATMSHTTLRTGRGRTSPVRGSVIMMQCMVFVHQQTMVCHGRGDDDWQLARTEISASANSRLALSVALLRPLNTRRALGSSQRVLSVMQPSFCPARRPDDRVRRGRSRLSTLKDNFLSRWRVILTDGLLRFKSIVPKGMATGGY